MADINHKNEELNYKNDFSEMFVKLIDAMVDYEHFSRETLVDALCRLARSFRLTEGVETVEQVQILRDNSCEYAGYYFDKPLPLEEFEKRLEAGEYPVN